MYTGDPVEPCTAWVDGVGSQRQPLDVTYSDDHTNVGTVTGSASYEGDETHKPSSASTTFEIAKAPSYTTVTCPMDGIVFTGSAITPCTATVTGAGGLDQPVGVTYDDNVHVGTVTASAHYDGDRNHEASDGSATFSILAWTLSGFFKPVDMGPVLNIVKGGSTVPLKFTVLAGDTAVTDTAMLGGTFTQTLVACPNTASMLTDDMSSFTTTGGTALRYDATGRQWVQNWQTPKTAGSCYTVTLQTADGSTLVAAFKTK